MAPAHPALIFGASTIGDSYNTIEEVIEILALLKVNNIKQIDTAALYPWTNLGMSETLLGQAHAVQGGFHIDTKILVMSKDANGTLEADKIEKSVTTSLERLQCQDSSAKLNVLYCHAPDFTTPLEDQAATLNALYRKGVYKSLGVSNFPLDMLTKFVQLCKEKGYIQPTIYQGLYNVVSRGHEQLFPFLRENGIQFVAHSPVATGFLSGKFTAGKHEDTRFGGDDLTATSLRGQWDKPELHQAIKALNATLEPTGITSIEAALRWISYHSKLTPSDAIILGATKMSYIEQNVASLGKGELPADVVSAMDAIWATLEK